MPDDSVGPEPTLTPEEEARGDALPAGAKLGQYEIVRLLGRGGMGIVYLPHHSVLERDFALKVLPDEFAERPGFITRFKREAKVMANLDHPRIVRVDEFGETNDRYWLRMEAVLQPDRTGRTLADLSAAKGGKLPPDELRPIVVQILEALEHAHSKGVIHRDLKPANILVAPDGSAKVSDFGLVKLVGEEFVRSKAEQSVSHSMSIGGLETIQPTEVGASTHALLGTYEYMSPEQKRGEEVDARTDLYSLGVMVYRLLTGLEGLGFKLPSQIDSNTPLFWDDFVSQSAVPDPSERFGSASEARELVRRGRTGGRPASVAGVSESRRPDRPSGLREPVPPAVEPRPAEIKREPVPAPRA